MTKSDALELPKLIFGANGELIIAASPTSSKDDFNIFEGKPIVVVFRWDARDKDNPVWSQAFSDDNGQHWEWNWFMYFSKFAKK